MLTDRHRPSADGDALSLVDVHGDRPHADDNVDVVAWSKRFCACIEAVSTAGHIVTLLSIDARSIANRTFPGFHKRMSLGRIPVRGKLTQPGLFSVYLALRTLQMCKRA